MLVMLGKGSTIDPTPSGGLFHSSSADTPFYLRGFTLAVLTAWNVSPDSMNSSLGLNSAKLSPPQGILPVIPNAPSFAFLQLDLQCIP
jgi:hypothetical protein